MSRRMFLQRAGVGLGTIAVVGTGALAYRAYDQGVLVSGDGPAYAPWGSWHDGQGLLPLVGAATLAPSPHNAQAWLFGVHRDHIDVFADHSRSIGAIDPFLRELHVGIGAAIENLVLQAGSERLSPDLELVPLGVSSNHAARVVLTPAARRAASLCANIPHRHTNRYPYVVDKEIPNAALDAMREVADPTAPDVAVHWITSPADRGQMGELLVAATEAIVADEEQSESDYRWFRQSWDEIQRRRDGITMDAAGLSDLTTSLAKLLPAQSRRATGEAWIRSTRERHTRTAAAYGIVVARDAGDVRQRIEGGRLLQRIHLWTTGQGLALHHMNQITERADRELELGSKPRFADVLGDLVPDGWQVLSTFRLGFPTRSARPSPRRAVSEVMAR
jgi:nitroreductase